MSQLGNLGLSQALVRRVAENHERHRPDEVARYYSSAVVLLAGVAVLLFGSLLAMRHDVLRLLGLSSEDADMYGRLAIGVFALSVATFVVDAVASLLSGIGRIDLYNYSQLVTQTIAVCLSLLFLSQHLGLYGMLAAQMLGYGSGLLFALVAIRRKLRAWPLRVRYFSIGHLRELCGQGSLIAGAWALSLAFHPLNKILLAQAGRMAELPIYEIAVNLSMRLRNLFESSQRPLMPETSRLMGTENFSTGSIRRLLRSSLKYLFLVAGPMYVLVFIGSTPLTHVWLRHSFSPFIPGVLRCFLVGTFISLLGTPFYYGLIGAGRAQLVLIANGLQLAVSVVGVCVLLHYGLIAAGSDLYKVVCVADVALAVSTVVLFKGMRSWLHSFGKQKQQCLEPLAA
jgi:O-antigen/teichoic acid export membrane protein